MGSPRGGAGKLRAPCVSPRGSAGASSRQPVACRQPLHSGSRGLSRNRQIIPPSGWGCGSCMGEGLRMAPPEAQEGEVACGIRTQSPSSCGRPPSPAQAALINLLSLAKIIEPSISEMDP